MNTIPTTFNSTLPGYTAVGGTERRASTGLSAVLLNRGGRYPRYRLLEDMEKAGFDYVLSMEPASARYDLEALTGSFPFVRFILLKQPLSPGEEINLAAAELSCPLFFVLWNDLKILRSGGADRMAERLLSAGTKQSPQGEAGAAGAQGVYKRLCTVPLVQDSRSEPLPTLISPALLPGRKRGSLKTMRFFPRKEGTRSLYPFDGIGIYDRERFIRLGGYDSSIRSFYWQLMDFGFRASLWGEEVASTQLVKLSYEGEVPQEDSSPGDDRRRFWLKNLVPVFRGDYAHIPLRRFPAYLRNASGLANAWKEFSAAREWVKINRYRFTSGAETIMERWENEELQALSGGIVHGSPDDTPGDEA